MIYALRAFSSARKFSRRYVLGGDGLESNPPPEGAWSMLPVGHRGASAQLPENTMPAFKWAVANGVRAIELDVQCTADKKLVVLHDLTLRRTCPEGSGVDASLLDTPVNQLSWDKIRDVPVGSVGGKPVYPVLLQRVLDWLPEDATVFVEVKRETAAYELTAQAVQSYAGKGEIRVISFSLEGIRRVKELCPAHKCYWVVKVAPWPFGSQEELYSFVDQAAEAGLDGLDCNAESSIVDAAVCSHAHSLGLDIVVWRSPVECESAHLFSQMANAGVDAFTSDLPHEFMEWRDAAMLTSGVRNTAHANLPRSRYNQRATSRILLRSAPRVSRSVD